MPPRSRQTPPTIPGYRLERPLGEGGMATAWLAVQLSLGREVALKVLDPMLAADAGFVERFVREAQVLASLRHRHIVAIHDVGVADGLPYLAMEFMHQGSIVPLCGQCDALTALRCVREIGDALGHAHARGIIHRDVKPENILRGEDGGFVLGDFGIARVANAGALAAPTAPGLAFGTPAYMAPERWRDAPVDGRSDFYSLGCVLHALLTGRPPYGATEQVALGHKHLSEPIPLLPAPFEALQGLLARLLAKDPADRHPDAAAIVAHVQALEHELAPGVRASGGETRLLSEWPFGTGEKLLTPTAHESAPPSASRATWRSRWLAVALGLAGAAGLAGFLASRPDAPPPGGGAPPLAVLPFRAEGGDSDMVRLADVVSEDLSSQLARVPGMRVVARTSVLSVAGGERDARTLAKRLQADLLLDGTVRRGEGGVLNLRVQLVDGRSGMQSWSTDTSAMPDRLWEAVAVATERLALHLLPQAQAAQPLVARSRVPAANEAYLRGRQALSAVAGNDLPTATAAFEEALRLDPQFGAAAAGLCRANLRAFERARSADQFTRAETACGLAVQLEPGEPEVALSMGDLLRARSDYEGALAYYGRVVDDPALGADALFGRARALAALHRDAEAEEAFRRAQATLPGYWPVYYQAGNFHLSGQRLDRAIDAYQTAASLGGHGDLALYNNLGIAYFLSDRLADAESAFSVSLARDRNHGALNNIGTLRFYLGNYEGALEMYLEALALQPDDYRVYGNLADTLVARGRPMAEVLGLYRRAASGAEKFLPTQPDNADAAAELAWYWVNIGRDADARALVAGLVDREGVDRALPLRLAGVLLKLGDPAGARAQIERARGLKMPETAIRGTPWLAPLIEPAVESAAARR